MPAMRSPACYAAVLYLALAWTGLAWPEQLRVATDLRQTGTLSETQRIPVVLFFSTGDCGYCETVRSEFLDPIATGGSTTSEVLLREIRFDSQDPLVGFDNRQTTHARLAKRRGIAIVPTIQFTDGRGIELADQIVGLGTAGFYGAYLEQGIERAYDRLRDKMRTSQ
jgi:hypothetical protein